MNKQAAPIQYDLNFSKKIEHLIHLVELKTRLQVYVEHLQKWNAEHDKGLTYHKISSPRDDAFKKAKHMLENMGHIIQRMKELTADKDRQTERRSMSA